MESCTNCPYSRFPKIPQSKRFKCRVAIVGEAPGASEIAHKQAFIGPSGQLLNKALASTALPPREEIFVTNSLLCKPPQNKPQINTAIKNCQGRLIEELEEVQPELIIALGNIAMHALTDDFGLKITKEQGRILESPYLNSCKIIPMIHPAAILRAPGDYKLFYGTMHRASQLFNGTSSHDVGVTKWKVIETEEDFQLALRVLSTRKKVGADIETTGLNPRKDAILVMGVAYEKNKVLVFPPDMIRKELFELPIEWIWQNGKFDIQFLRRKGMLADVHHDTMLLSYCLNEHSGVHELEQLSSRELGAAPYKHEVSKKVGKNFADLTPEELFKRVSVDADYTLQIFDKLYVRVSANPGLLNVYNKFMIPASNFLRRVQRNGIYVNQDLLQEFKREYQEHLDDINDQILEIAQPLWDPKGYIQDTGMKSAPEVFNPGSTYQVAWILYDVLRLRPRGRMKGRSTDKEMLMKMEGMHPLIDLMLEYRSVAKELSTYIIGVEEHIAGDGRVHTTYKLHGTVTGRLSSAEPNVQNQPKRKPKVRNIFQAPPGKKLLEVDYKGAELRVLAHISGDPDLTTCFVEGRDLHAEVAKALNAPRIRAKAVNFGIAYGRTEYSFAEEFGVSVEEARQYLVDWFARFPVAKKYMDRCARSVVEGKILVTPFGRHRRFGLITADNVKELQNEARNFVIQSVASDLTLLSAMQAEEPLGILGVKIINLVHDSILLECPDDEKVIYESIRILKDIMERVPKEELGSEVPFGIDASVGTEWGKLQELEVDKIAIRRDSTIDTEGAISRT